MAGTERGGEKEEIIRKREQRAYFSHILLSPGDCKIRDWSELLIRQSRAQSNALIGHNYFLSLLKVLEIRVSQFTSNIVSKWGWKACMTSFLSLPLASSVLANDFFPGLPSSPTFHRLL